MNAKGQEAAPFEVLISVIIMGFVIVVALYAMQTVTEEQCKAQIREQGTQLKAKVEEVVKGNSTTLDFFPPRCFADKGETMQLQIVRNESLCNAWCGGTKLECMVFFYESDEYTERICLERASVQTQFLSDATDGGPCDQPGYRAVSFMINRDNPDGILRGHYNLVNTSPSTGAFPAICAYRRE